MTEAFGFVQQLNHAVRMAPEDQVGESNERCPLSSNFDAKQIHEVKGVTQIKLFLKSPTFSQRSAGLLVL